MNLITGKFIRIKRQSGKIDTIPPSEITNGPVVSLAYERPDLNSSMVQFLIGLLQTAFQPQTTEDWIKWLESPPSPDQLKAAFTPYESAFHILNTDGPAFLQDYEDLPHDPKPIEALLIDAPGGNAIKNNTDHFVKRGRVEGMCPVCVAATLFTMQCNAPAGGVGHRTSMRGGGPLTTLVWSDPARSGMEESLWQNLWLNVLPKDYMDFSHEHGDLTKIFPWLAPTRTSESKGGVGTYPVIEDAHPLQMYWGMPRRIRLITDEQNGSCDLCGQDDVPLVTQFNTKNYGVDYLGDWRHPLSPHQVRKQNEHPLPMHPQPGGLRYRDWPGMVYGINRDGEGIEPARVIESFHQNIPAGLPCRIWASGYDMDKMKARCWYETRMPLYHVPMEYRDRLAARVDTLVDASNKVASFLRSAVREAWFRRPTDHKGDTNFVIDSFISRTHDAFFQSIEALMESFNSGSEEAVCHHWYDVIKKTAVLLFLQWAESGNFSESDMKRISRAYRFLMGNLHSKKLRQLLMLDDKRKEVVS